MAFLSDELYDLGIDANPKNNASQGKQAIKMLDLLIEAKAKPKANIQQLQNITRNACNKLNEKGFPYYTFDIFWEEIKKNEEK